MDDDSHPTMFASLARDALPRSLEVNRRITQLAKHEGPVLS